MLGNNRPHYILLPVNPLFIAFSLVCAFMLNLLPWGRWVGAPDFVALVLVFWGIHQPRKSASASPSAWAS